MCHVIKTCDLSWNRPCFDTVYQWKNRICNIFEPNVHGSKWDRHASLGIYGAFKVLYLRYGNGVLWLVNMKIS